MKTRIYTLGHSTRTLEEFIEILKVYEIIFVVDVRRYPRSSKYSHFNRENLKEVLAKNGIEYVWLGEMLGGMRKARKYKGKPWGGYLEHMETEEFKKGLDILIDLAKRGTTAILCAEKLYFKCHRLLISLKLIELGFAVIHIIEKNKVYEQKSKKPSLELPELL